MQWLVQYNYTEKGMDRFYNVSKSDEIIALWSAGKCIKNIFFSFAVITKEKVWLAKVGKWKQLHILTEVTGSS